MRRVRGISLVVACLTGMALSTISTISTAKFANIWQPIPIERLIQNTLKYIDAHPKDPQGYYTLGRLHSLAWARAESARATQDAASLPSFSPFEPEFGAVNGNTPPADKNAAEHFRASLKGYARTVELDPKDGVAWLGIAWMLEQGAPQAESLEIQGIPGLDGDKATRLDKAHALAASLRAYRKAYSLLLSPERTKPLGVRTSLFSPEAGEGIIRLLSRRPQTAAEKTEVARIKTEIAEIRARPHPITPIVFSSAQTSNVAQLVRSGKAVTFDLAGTGLRQRWPWVRPDTGILVWDPEGKGRITSGTQLFGSRTWQMFWPDGYAALAALDDDRDGRLAGFELRGIAVWRDANGNGRAERGEVVPVVRLGVRSIRVRSVGVNDGTLWNPRGIEMRSGQALPSYDWTPSSLSTTE